MARSRYSVREAQAVKAAAMAERELAPPVVPRRGRRRGRTPWGERLHGQRTMAVPRVYHLTATEMAIVQSAKTARDIDVKIRNRLYAAIGRDCASKALTPSACRKWSACSAKGGRTRKFCFLKAWAKDPSGVSISVSETDTKPRTKGEEQWITRFELYARYSAYQDVEAKEVCDAALGAAKEKRSTHHRHERDARFNLFLVPKELIEGKADVSELGRSLHAGGIVASDAGKSGVQFGVSLGKVWPSDRYTREEQALRRKRKAVSSDQEEGPAPPHSHRKQKAGEIQDEFKEEKICADFMALDATLQDLKDHSSLLRATRSLATIRNTMACLRGLYARWQDATLDAVAGELETKKRVWMEALPILTVAKADIEGARQRLLAVGCLRPAIYSTKFDSVMS